MAPQLDAATHFLIHALLEEGYKSSIIASVAQCSIRAVQRIQLKKKKKRTSMSTPRQRRVGRRSRITPSMGKYLLALLREEPDIYMEEMADCLFERFGDRVSERSIGRFLRSAGWSRKKIRRIAHQRDDDLRDYYLFLLGELRVEDEQIIFVDESGCDRRAAYRHSGWAPLGISPTKKDKFGRGDRWHILPAYSMKGIVLSRIYQGSTDAALFEDFISELLLFCGKFPEPNSVLVMDNASWHHSEKIRRMCAEAGVKLVYLPPYSPDFNPIEEFFSVLKKFIKKTWRRNKDFATADFKSYLEWCVERVGSRAALAEAHFRHAGIPITHSQI